MERSIKRLVALVALALLVAGCLAPQDAKPTPSATSGSPTPSATTTGGSAAIEMRDTAYSPKVLAVPVGAKVTWTNRDPIRHTVTPADPQAWGDGGSGVDIADWLDQGGSYSKTFTTPGTYVYYCVPHAAQGDDGEWLGMVGTIVVGASSNLPGPAATPPFTMPNLTVVPDPAAPARLQPDADGVVRVTLETREVVAQLADGAAYSFWTFDGTVPGPMLRIREGDTVELTLKNAGTSTLPHSIDLHAVTGPGGGAVATQTPPGGETSFRFKALNAGLFVYHCASPHIPSHIANGMYGLILVEPAEGLPPVDREYFIVQGEIYAKDKLGSTGLQAFSLEKLLDERPTYFLMNGRVGALTGDGALRAEVGETVRIYYGVGGFVPSNFHVIGEIFDKVYPEGGTAPHENVQTTLIPAGGAAIVEFTVQVPGNYLLVDHALTHSIDKGAAGILVVTGPADEDVFQAETTSGAGD